MGLDVRALCRCDLSIDIYVVAVEIDGALGSGKSPAQAHSGLGQRLGIFQRYAAVCKLALGLVETGAQLLAFCEGGRSGLVLLLILRKLSLGIREPLAEVVICRHRITQQL